MCTLVCFDVVVFFSFRLQIRKLLAFDAMK